MARVSAAEVRLADARRVLQAVQARPAPAQQPNGGGGAGETDLWAAQQVRAHELADARLGEARAAQELADTQVAVARAKGNVDGRLAMNASLARAKEGDAEVALGHAKTQLVRAQRVVEGAAQSGAATATRADRMNVEAIDDPGVAARLYLDQGAGAGQNVAMTRRAVFESQWREFHRQMTQPPAAGWRRADGSVVIDVSNPQVRAAVERLAKERKSPS